MSRLATLSSKLEHYREAISDLQALYMVRGYPEALVKTWSKEYFRVSWEKRLMVTEERPRNLLVLKTEFNPIWSAFNVHELGKTITDSWQSSLAVLDRQASANVRTWHLDTAGTVATAMRQLTLYDMVAPRSKSPAHPSSEAGAGVQPDLVPADGDLNAEGNSELAKPVADFGVAQVHQIPTMEAVEKSKRMYGRGPVYVLRPSVLPSQSGPSRLRPTEHTSTPGAFRATGSGAAGEPSGAAAPASGSAVGIDGKEELVSGVGEKTLGDDGNECVPKRIATRFVNGSMRESALDIRTVGLCDSEWLVSRKKRTNLGDIVNSWKHVLLERASSSDSVSMHVDEWQ